MKNDKVNDSVKLKGVYICAIVAIAIVYLIFAIIPDLFGVHPMPTGGWDWLNFIGVVLAASIALKGISITLKVENDRMFKQQQLNVVPVLEVIVSKKYNCEDMNNVYRILEDKDGKLVNNGYKKSVSNNDKLPEGFEVSMNLNIKNVGLSTAFTIDTFIYSLKSIEGLETIEDLRASKNREIIDDLYEKMNVENYVYLETGKELMDLWQIYTSFNLPNSLSYETNLNFDNRKIENDFHSIMEFQFKDIYENKYYQYMYLFWNKTEVMNYPISKIYTKSKVIKQDFEKTELVKV